MSLNKTGRYCRSLLGTHFNAAFYLKFSITNPTTTTSITNQSIILRLKNFVFISDLLDCVRSIKQPECQSQKCVKTGDGSRTLAETKFLELHDPISGTKLINDRRDRDRVPVDFGDFHQSTGARCEEYGFSLFESV